MKNEEEKKENFKVKINFEISKRVVWSTLALIFTLAFTYLQIIGYLIPGFNEIIMLDDTTTTIQDVGFIWISVISYFLVSLNICIFTNIFKKLKTWEENGLIFVLTICITVLFIGSLLGSVIANILLRTSSISQLLHFTIILTTAFIMIGLGFGPLVGLSKELNFKKEFKKRKKE